MSLAVLIDTRAAEPGPARPEVVPDWRLWTWLVAGLGSFIAATYAAGGVSVLLAFAGFLGLCKALETFAGSYGEGLTEWRQ